MQSKMDDLMRALNENASIVNLSSEDWSDINIVACTIKQYFRELPDPLLTSSLYDEFISSVRKIPPIFIYLTTSRNSGL